MQSPNLHLLFFQMSFILYYLKAGDLQEAKAIYDAYCIGRKVPLPIGLLKSNVGHGEGASGVTSIAKTIITFENECIPPNLNLNKLKPEIAELGDILNPVNDNLPYIPGISSLNKSYFNCIITLYILSPT